MNSLLYLANHFKKTTLSILCLLTGLGLVEKAVFAQDFVPVCKRSQAVREELEYQVGKNCKHIDGADLAKLVSLTLAKREPMSSLTAFKKGDFSGLKKVTMIFIANTAIEVLPDGVFSELEDLRFIRIFRNGKLRRIESKVFQDFKNIWYINLSQNAIEEVPDTLLSGLENLKCFYIYDNRIKELDPDFFQNKPKLERIVLSSNQLTDVGAKTFRELPALKFVGIGGNPLSVSSIFDLRSLGKLTDIDDYFSPGADPFQLHSYFCRFKYVMGSESHGKILSLGESAEFKAGSNTTEGFVNYRKNGVIFVSVTNGKFSGQDSAPGHRRTVGPSVLYDSYGVQMSLLSENKPGLFCLRID